ncbi:hypothetical protein TVAG_347220 [Trichomonas vaginalis G3]|uniref:Uncharacterized protein n=1 Tax=Trichomonas vaginalis (strain ATCC PRA-98 / G3) TaxID=412133 RepID=A2FSG8_TRIV3|nr:hypothetical protein TVAG_347220 [Trichomonas vaginalis G3]|eukprot:XP_001305069.1 hypothetical protein [Trichomonas vaginalis G3]
MSRRFFTVFAFFCKSEDVFFKYIVQNPSDNDIYKFVIYSLSAISIGSSIIGHCKFDDFSNVVAYHSIPFFSAFLSSIIAILTMIGSLNESILFIKNRELLLTIFNILFIISTGVVGYSKNVTVVLVFRGFQGFAIVFLAFVNTITISEMDRYCNGIYLLIFALGLSLGNTCLDSWPILALITSSLQLLLIWTCKANFKMYIDVEAEMFIGDESLDFLVHIFNAIYASVGSLGIFIYNYRSTETRAETFFYDLPFFLCAVFSVIVIYCITNKNHEPLFYNYVSIIVLFIGFALYYFEHKARKYVISSGLGLGVFVPWFRYFTDKYNRASLVFTWGCFWLANGCFSFLYLYVTPHTWSLVGWIITAIIIFVTLVVLYILLVKFIGDSSCTIDNEVFWDICLGLGGILVRTIIAPGYYESTDSDPFGIWGVYSSYPPLFAAFGLVITCIGVGCDIIKDTRISFALVNFAYILFTGLMNIKGTTVMIVFKYFQSITIGAYSALIPIMLANVASWDDNYFHAMSFYLLMIPLGMFLSSFSQRDYLYYVYVLPVLYILIIVFTSNWTDGCEIENQYKHFTHFQAGLAILGSFFGGFCLNSQWVYNHHGYGFFMALVQCVISAVFHIIYSIMKGCDCIEDCGYIVLKVFMIMLELSACIIAIIYMNTDATELALLPLSASYDFGIFQIPFLKSAEDLDTLTIVVFQFFVWFFSTISGVMWYYIPRITSILVMTGFLLAVIANIVRQFCF